jgi:hypothetical protein
MASREQRAYASWEGETKEEEDEGIEDFDEEPRFNRPPPRSRLYSLIKS